MKSNIIEITGPTVLQIGGCRITVEPSASASGSFSLHPAKPGMPSSTTPGEWRKAEEELQSKSNMPFEPPSICRTERLSLSPRVGGKFRAVSGIEVEIASVIGRDGALWFVIDTKGRPAALRRIEFRWHALPRDLRRPAVGEVIIHNDVQSTVAGVIGEAEVGGWAVTNNHGLPLHVLRGEANHWISLGPVAVQR